MAGSCRGTSREDKAASNAREEVCLTAVNGASGSLTAGAACLWSGPEVSSLGGPVNSFLGRTTAGEPDRLSLQTRRWPDVCDCYVVILTREEALLAGRAFADDVKA